MTQKFLVTTTGKSPSENISFTDLPNKFVIIHPTRDRDFMNPDFFTKVANTYNDLITSPQIKEALRNNWITVKDEHGLTLDSIVGRHIDVSTIDLNDADVLQYKQAGDEFDWTTGSGAGDMLKSTYDTNDDGKVNSADSSDTVAGTTTANQYYGTDGSNTKGFYDLPAGGGGDMLAATYDPTNVAGDAFNADNSVFDPNGDITSTNVQAAIVEVRDDTDTKLSGKADTSHTHDTADITTGTFANARIAESNVTQHEAAINHDNLLGFVLDEHRPMNDASTTTTNLWSATKISNEISNATSGIASALLPPVQDITALKAIDTTSAVDYPDKIMINVEDNGLYRLDRQSSATEDLDRIVAPTTGTGRWIKMSASINDHNLLSNIQGGTTGQYYHLTLPELTVVQNTSGTNTGDEVTATTTLEGLVELATLTEVNNGTAGALAVTADTLANSQLATDVTANNAKVSNVDHTGEVATTIGANLAVQSTAISNKTLVTAASGDHVLIVDADDGNLKKVDVSGFLTGSPDFTGSTLLADAIVTSQALNNTVGTKPTGGSSLFVQALPPTATATILPASFVNIKNTYATDRNNYVGMLLQNKPDADTERIYGGMYLAENAAVGYRGGLYFGVSSRDNAALMNWVFNLTQPTTTNEGTETGMAFEPGRWISNSFSNSTDPNQFGRCEKFGFQAQSNRTGAAFGVRALAGQGSVVMGYDLGSLALNEAVLIGSNGYSGLGTGSPVGSGLGIVIGSGADGSSGSGNILISRRGRTAGDSAIGMGSGVYAGANSVVSGASSSGGSSSVVIGASNNAASVTFTNGIPASPTNTATHYVAVGGGQTDAIGTSSIRIGARAREVGFRSILLATTRTSFGAASQSTATGDYTVAAGYEVRSTGDYNILSGNEANDNGFSNVIVIGNHGGQNSGINKDNQAAFGGSSTVGTGGHIDEFYFGSGLGASSDLRASGKVDFHVSHSSTGGSTGLAGIDVRWYAGRGRSNGDPGRFIINTSVPSSNVSSLQPWFDRFEIDTNGTIIQKNLSSTADGSTVSGEAFQQGVGGIVDLFANSFKLHGKIEHSSGVYTNLWISDGTTPNGVLVGARGDYCINGDSDGNVYICQSDGLGGATGTVWYKAALATPFQTANNVRKVTDANITVSHLTDNIVVGKPVTVNMIATLPDSTTCEDKIFRIKRGIKDTTYTFVVGTVLGQKIDDDLTSYNLNTAGASVTLISLGADGWGIL
jgi:hypothetical protein